MIEVRYNLNMVPDKGSPIHINVSQNDDKCRTFIFKLYSSDGSWTAPASATATIEGRKDDGKFFSFACTYSSGEVTVIVQQQMVAVAGKVRCKLKLVSGAETIESAPFYFVVNPKSMPVNADMSKSDVVDAVAKATQKIVDQVAENIPEDYVKLNEDVSGLKSDIDDYVINVSILNIYDKSATDNIINYALQPNGEPIEFDGRCVTEFIKLDANTDYQMINYQNGISAICFYDNSKVFINKNGKWHDPISVIEIPSEKFVRHIRVELFNITSFDSIKLLICKKGLLDGNYHEYNEVKKEYKFGTGSIDNTANFITESEAKQLITKPYEKLKWYALGDSYTEQGYYTSKIVEKTGMILTNYGVGGTRLADSDGNQSNAMCYRYLDMSEEKPDFITVMGGTNDCYYSTLGKAGDTSVSTVAGAIYVIYKGLQEKYPNTPILFASMPVRWDSRFEEYANIMIDTCKYWRIPCVDIYHNCGFNDWNKCIYNLNGDRIHVNENGGKVLAQLFIDAMNKVIY